jgi:hypothetical protein
MNMHNFEVFSAKDKTAIPIEIHVTLTSVYCCYLLVLFLNIDSDPFPYVTDIQTRVTPVQILTETFIICYTDFASYNFLCLRLYSCLYAIEQYVEADI